MIIENIPLSLYIHIPWCVEKCPYCDFNSHGLKSAVPENEYVSHLLDDLRQDAELVKGRQIQTIFIGGGTPSLFSPKAIQNLLAGVQKILPLCDDAEVTLEANPGTVESEKFTGFRQGGVNRISIGIQSFQQQKLQSLGRIHDPRQAINAAHFATQAGLNSFNLDLMHGLPEQTEEDALSDLAQGIALAPAHLSWYQLTIEPNTLFYSQPPELPEDDTLWNIQDRGHQLLTDAGYQQYEISGYSQPGQQCQHNLNYWRFGDYLGIGCGAHGKITTSQGIIRRVKVKHPKGYMDLTKDYCDKQTLVSEEDLPFEFFMNRFRLLEPCPKQDFTRMTGLPLSTITEQLNRAIELGLIDDNEHNWQITTLGKRYLNSLLELFV